MGGGRRTFPGGLNKWQYKRMHEKLAREKERRLLDEERQVYQARLRSEIRAKLAGKSSTDADIKQHIKALADRFMKAGAEDLWNDDDGPIRSPPDRPLPSGVSNRRNLLGSREDGASSASSGVGGFQQRREYPTTRFDECGISPLTLKALTEAGYVQMTVVQEAALPVCLDGKDALVKAKTGPGKSAAFLLPAIETVVKATRENTNRRIPQIYALILCPTRELAIQVAAEAKVLLRYHDGIGVQILIGGTAFKVDQKLLESNPSQIMVATPGRLLDHIENKIGFSLLGLKMLILDEADHLLDLGFRKDIEKIVDYVPRQRRSLLFTATLPKEVHRVSRVVLNRDHAFVDTVGLGGVETHTKGSWLVRVHTNGEHQGE